MSALLDKSKVLASALAQHPVEAAAIFDALTDIATQKKAAMVALARFVVALNRADEPASLKTWLFLAEWAVTGAERDAAIDAVKNSTKAPSR